MGEAAHTSFYNTGSGRDKVHLSNKCTLFRGGERIEKAKDLTQRRKGKRKTQRVGFPTSFWLGVCRIRLHDGIDQRTDKFPRIRDFD